MRRVKIIDSHTAGEPTRVVIAGGPDLGNGPIGERLERFRNEFDDFRSAVVNEPRGNDAIVGALLCEPFEPSCQAGVIFFNNVGYLKMCGHGTIGLMVTLAHLKKIEYSACRLDTVAGVVEAHLNEDGSVSLRNVASYRKAQAVPVEVPGIGRVVGDIAWGGNWFYLVNNHGQTLSVERIEELTEFTWRIRQALAANGITGDGGQEIDHIELYGPPSSSADSRNFVLCPGRAYDRSPCGTGTSAKLACLYADGKLREGQIWRQESIVGSIFAGSVSVEDGRIYPRITGRAYVNAEADLILDERDPFCYGIRRSWASAT
jgi:4-hydroxyproline epimerase